MLFLLNDLTLNYDYTINIKKNNEHCLQVLLAHRHIFVTVLCVLLSVGIIGTFFFKKEAGNALKVNGKHCHNQVFWDSIGTYFSWRYVISAGPCDLPYYPWNIHALVLVFPWTCHLSWCWSELTIMSFDLTHMVTVIDLCQQAHGYPNIGSRNRTI